MATSTAHGSLDLVTANSSSGTLSVLLNPEQWRAQQGANVAVPAGPPRDVALADLDEDGDNDLCSSRFAKAPALLVYRNLGGGTFAAPAPYGSSVNAFSLQIADFNLDNRVDVAIAHGLCEYRCVPQSRRGRLCPTRVPGRQLRYHHVADVAAGDERRWRGGLVGVLLNSGDVTLLLISGAERFQYLRPRLRSPLSRPQGWHSPTSMVTATTTLWWWMKAEAAPIIARNNGLERSAITCALALRTPSPLR